MIIEHKDFIGTYKDVYPDGYCQHLINEFERLVDSGAGSSRQKHEGVHKHEKDDTYLHLNIGVHSVADFHTTPAERGFFLGLQRCYDTYAEEFSILKNGKLRATAMKMQKTPPGGGYHVWHGEQNNLAAERALVYTLYLNDLGEADGGETEFLYQRLRIRPQENTMVVWPAAFTHAHRGNTVLGEQSKYIVTGWFYYE